MEAQQDSFHEPNFIMRSPGKGGGRVLDDELKSHIKCTKCSEIPFAPTFVCENGHMMCKDCKLQPRGHCKICGKEAKSQNLPLDHLISSSFLSCRYASDGCKAIRRGDAMEAHMSKCDYGPVLCPYGLNGCNSLVNLSKLPRHLLDLHEGPLESALPIPNKYIRTTFPIDSKKISASTPSLLARKLVTFENKTFIFAALGRDSMMSLVVFLIGIAEEAKHYKVKISVPAETDEDGVTWVGGVFAPSKTSTIIDHVRDKSKALQPLLGFAYLKALGEMNQQGLTVISCAATLSRHDEKDEVTSSPISGKIPIAQLQSQHINYLTQTKPTQSRVEAAKAADWNPGCHPAKKAKQGP